jgi:hypothetical protein
MKLFRRILVVVVLAFLFGCQTTTESTTTTPKLNTPENLVFDGVVSWNEVNNALSYDVYINDDLINVDDNIYVIEEEGTYSIYVIAKADGYIDSEPSLTLDIEVDYENNIEFTIDIDDEVVSWNEVEDATGYNLFINGVKTEVEENSFNLQTTNAGLLRISVQAIYPIGESNVSQVYNYEHNLIETAKIMFQYSLNSNIDIIVWNDIEQGNIYVQDLDLEFLDKDSMLGYSDNHLYIKSSFLVEQPIGLMSFYLIHGAYKTLVEVTLNTKTEPYIISSTVIRVDGTEDVMLQFELFGGSFYSINGSEGDTVLYEINDSILTIEKEFISGKFENYESFILSYAINKDDSTVIGYLFFYEE